MTEQGLHNNRTMTAERVEMNTQRKHGRTHPQGGAKSGTKRPQTHYNHIQFPPFSRMARVNHDIHLTPSNAGQTVTRI